jgi:hypothetical protein
LLNFFPDGFGPSSIERPLGIDLARFFVAAAALAEPPICRHMPASRTKTSLVIDVHDMPSNPFTKPGSIFSVLEYRP